MTTIVVHIFFTVWLNNVMGLSSKFDSSQDLCTDGAMDACMPAVLLILMLLVEHQVYH